MAMQPWSYYDENPYQVPSMSAIRAAIAKKIDDTPMTKTERDAAMANVDRDTRSAWDWQMAPHSAHSRKMEAEFWQHARATLEYDRILDGEGTALLEQKAWQDGHSAGFSEVCGHLEDLTDFANDMIRCNTLDR